MVHPIIGLPGPLCPFSWSIWSFRDQWEVIGGHFLPWNKLWNPRYILNKIWYIFKKFWYIQSSSYQDPYLPSHSPFCETKVWLISILVITKQGLELMIKFQVWLGKKISKVAITKTNQATEKSIRRRPQKKVFFKT